MVRSAHPTRVSWKTPGRRPAQGFRARPLVDEDILEPFVVQDVTDPAVQGVDVGTIETLAELIGELPEALSHQALQDLGLPLSPALTAALFQTGCAAFPDAPAFPGGGELYILAVSCTYSGVSCTFWP